MTIIPNSDPRYPERLRHIPDPPRQLYCRGNLALLSSECIAIVGTRKLTPYGKEACQHITGELARAGLTIVSGLAFGIDTIAHRTALEHRGKTIAVLGTGIDDDTIYPVANQKLAHTILVEDGLIISEYPPGTPGLKHQFPERNRIISGLSLGVLVVEADIDSGSLITAKHAIEQNRDVFAIPGGIFSLRSAGSNALIRQGAKLVTSARDILEEYGHNSSLLRRIGEHLSTEHPNQKRILDILAEKGPLSVDAIIHESGITPPETMSALSMLELTGLVARLTNGTYRTTAS